ncbi:unknown protein [Cronobacter turicensis z3032]|uniref:Uncharacterized protein n=1 Tax=Cronobacter turicensis (strain DSM 18703 / CCUG 55852 / LMG 23827 / z3032) TaxID=693216 RepID=C9Y3R0_CROTZ|nr:unknown protein [Cronobacter turicensis z3032]
MTTEVSRLKKTRRPAGFLLLKTKTSATGEKKPPAGWRF